MLLSLRCPDCGRRIDEAENFCPYCGTNLDAPLEKHELEALAQQFLEKAEKSFDRGFIKWSLDDCEQVLEIMPEMAEAHNLRGLILDEMGKGDEALLEYQEAVRLKPNYADAIANFEDAEAEYRNAHNQKVKHKTRLKLSIRSLIIVTIIGFVIQGARFLILVVSKGEPGNLYQLISNIDILGPALIYPFLANREEQIKFSSGVIAGAIISIPLGILKMFLGIIYLVFFPTAFVFDFTELQNVFSQSHPSLRLGALMGLLLAPTIVMIENSPLGAIGGAIGSFIVTTKNKLTENIDGQENS